MWIYRHARSRVYAFLRPRRHQPYYWLPFSLLVHPTSPLNFGYFSPPCPSPVGSAGPSRQFANMCGVFFAGVAWACLVGDKSLGARIMLVSS